MFKEYFMKNVNKVTKLPMLGFAVIAAIAFTFALTACDIPDEEEDGVFTDLWAFRDWYGEQPDNTPDTPYRVKLNYNFEKNDIQVSGFNLGLMYFGYQSKYVYLDLSGSTFTSIYGFDGRGNLVGIILPNSVTTIDNGTFRNCSNLTSITLSNSITSIGSYTFDSCAKLTDVTIPNNVTSIEDGAFASTGLTSIIIPNKVTRIGDSVFAGTRLTSITIPNSVTYLSGFRGCTGLTVITIPNSVTSIGGYAFNGCTGLTRVTIPSSVNSIKAGAFGSTNITSVTFEGTIPVSEFIHANIFVESESFPGDLRAKFYATNPDNGTPGTYTRTNGSNTWTKQ
jgi:hypothetical protein